MSTLTHSDRTIIKHVESAVMRSDGPISPEVAELAAKLVRLGAADRRRRDQASAPSTRSAATAEGSRPGDRSLMAEALRTGPAKLAKWQASSATATGQGEGRSPKRRAVIRIDQATSKVIGVQVFGRKGSAG